MTQIFTDRKDSHGVILAMVWGAVLALAVVIVSSLGGK